VLVTVFDLLEDEDLLFGGLLPAGLELLGHLVFESS